MADIIAVANQKGGVGKTTSCVSLAAEFACQGFKTLLVDLDSQGSASSGLSVELHPEGADVYDMFFGKKSLMSLIKPSNTENLSVVPASRDLVGLEIELGKAPGRELILRSELAQIKKSFDFIIIDCPPSSGLLTLNALGAAEQILIPLQAEYYALEGITALMNTIEFVRQTFNPTISLLGVFLTMYDSRTNLSAQVEREARNFFKTTMFLAKIPRNIRLSECPSHGLPICKYDPISAGAIAYKELSLEIVERLQKGKEMPLRAANQ